MKFSTNSGKVVEVYIARLTRGQRMEETNAQSFRESLLARKWTASTVVLITGFLFGLWLYYIGNRPPPPPTVPHLIRSLQKRETPLHKTYQLIWLVLPDIVRSRVPSLEPRPAADIRAMAAAQLTRFGEAARPAVPYLIKALHDPDDRVQLTAVQTIRELGLTASDGGPKLLEMFNDPGINPVASFPELRVQVAAALTKIAPRLPGALDTLIAAANSHSDPEFTARVIEALGSVEEAPASLLKPLSAWLQSTNLSIQHSAVRATGLLRASAVPLLPKLVELYEQLYEFQKQIPTLQTNTVRVLRWTAGGAQSQAANVLNSNSVQGPTPEAPSNVSGEFVNQLDSGAFTSLASTAPAGSTPPPVTSGPVTFVNAAQYRYGQIFFQATEREAIRNSLIETFGQIGPGAKVALPLLQREITNSLGSSLQYRSAFSKWQIDHDTNSALLVFSTALLKAPRRGRITAVDYIAQLGDAAIPALVDALDSDDANVRFAAVYALGQVGSKAVAAVPKLVPMLSNDSKYAVRTATEAALKRIQPAKAAQWKAQLLTNFIARHMVLEGGVLKPEKRH